MQPWAWASETDSNDTNDGNGDRENDGGRAHAINSSEMSGLAA
jgi:hypothetical protein